MLSDCVVEDREEGTHSIYCYLAGCANVIDKAHEDKDNVAMLAHAAYYHKDKAVMLAHAAYHAGWRVGLGDVPLCPDHANWALKG